MPDGVGDGRADEHELVTPWNVSAGTKQFPADHAFIRMIADQMGRDPADVAKLAWQFDDGVQIRIEANCYIFSASTEYSRELALGMKDKFDADAYVEISDPRAFMLALSNHKDLAGRPSCQDRVRYSSVEVDEYTGQNPFVKMDAFQWQKEFRTVWFGADPPGAIIIEVPSIVPLLKRIA